MRMKDFLPEDKRGTIISLKVGLRKTGADGEVALPGAPSNGCQ